VADLLDIAEVASRSGMAPSTLRYYEHEGIIASTERKGLRRQYAHGVLDTLAVVALCQRAGLSLSEIKDLIATGGDTSWKELAARKRDELRAQVEHLTMLADQIDHALACRSPNPFDCEHFQSALSRALPVGRVRRTTTESTCSVGISGGIR
jgi:DNA-binding transcriptional MerR regulator